MAQLSFHNCAFGHNDPDGKVYSTQIVSDSTVSGLEHIGAHIQTAARWTIRTGKS